MKGCLGIVLLFVVLAAGEYVFLLYTPLAGSIGLPLASAATIALALGTLWALFMAIKRRRALATPPERWADGDFVGFSGRIVSENRPLAAPGSGENAALYEYELKRTTERRTSDGTEHKDVTAFHGMAMAGCRVHAGVHAFRLVGFPILAQVPKTIVADAAELERIAKYLLTNEMKPKPPGIGATLRSLGEVLADADGIVHFDEGAHDAFDLEPYRTLHATDPAKAVADLAAFLADEEYFVEETRIPESEQVTVFGRYRSADRTIDVGSGLQNLERGISIGGAGSAPSGLVGSLVGFALFAGAAFGLHRWIGPPLWEAATAERYGGTRIGFDDAIAAALGRDGGGPGLTTLAQSDEARAVRLLTRLGADPNGEEGQLRPLQQAGSFETVKALLDAGAEPSFSGHQGASPLHHFTERGDAESVGLLLEKGARVDAVDDWDNTPLARAAVYGHVEIGRALLDAGADANHHAKDGSTPLDEARAHGKDEFVELLVKSGARETEVTAASGKPVALDDPPVRLLQAYEDALHARDTTTIAELKPSLRGYDWSTTDWDAMLGGRPVKITTANGYASGERATIRIDGPTADGKPRGLTVGFELSRDPAHDGHQGWRIDREWIEWGELEKRRR